MQIVYDFWHGWVICPTRKGLQEQYLRPSFKSNQVTIMIWACFCSKRIGPILTLNKEGINAVAYMHILSDSLMPMIDNLLEQLSDQDMIHDANENIYD